MVRKGELKPRCPYISQHIIQMEYMTNVIMRRASESLGETVEQVTSVLDVEGVTLSKAKRVMGLFPKLFAVDQDYYPEVMAATSACLTAASLFPRL